MMTATAGGSSSTGDHLTYSPWRRATDLLQLLAPGKMRIGFLIGAGCPLAIRVPDGSTEKPLIPDIAGLTERVKKAIADDGNLKAESEKVWNRVVLRGIARPTIEDVLSHIRTLSSLCPKKGEIDGFPGEKLIKLDQAICLEVKNVVSQTLPANDTPYHALASWIQAISRDKPVEIFTTNYDLLFEQALEEQRVPYFDGFVGSDSAFLDLESMAEDDLPARWARLWKIHGSVNWWMTEGEKIRRCRDNLGGKQLLIYPSHLKYDQSRQMPYYAMLDRLLAFLRSDQCVLITCGYSFADQHINAFITQGLSGNPNAVCVGMIFNDRADASEAVELAKRYPNLTLLAADGAVIGTIDRDWDSDNKNDHEPNYRIAVAAAGTELPVSRTKASKNQNRWLLGDFGAFGRLLAHQLSSRRIERGGSSAF